MHKNTVWNARQLAELPTTQSVYITSTLILKVRLYLLIANSAPWLGQRLAVVKGVGADGHTHDAPVGVIAKDNVLNGHGLCISRHFLFETVDV